MFASGKKQGGPLDGLHGDPMHLDKWMLIQLESKDLKDIHYLYDPSAGTFTTDQESAYRYSGTKIGKQAIDSDLKLADIRLQKNGMLDDWDLMIRYRQHK